MIPTGTTKYKYIRFHQVSNLRVGAQDAEQRDVEVVPQPFDVSDEEARDKAAAEIMDVPLGDLDLPRIHEHAQWFLGGEQNTAALALFTADVLGPNHSDPSFATGPKKTWGDEKDLA